MEGEEEVLKGTKTKYFELFPERNYKRGKKNKRMINWFCYSFMFFF